MMKIKKELPKIKDLILKNSIKFGIFMYLAALTIHIFNFEAYLKALIVFIVFAVIFGLKAKPYFIIALAVSSLQILSKNFNLDNYALTFYIIVFGLLLLEIRKQMKKKINFAGNKISKVFKKENIAKQASEIKKAIVEP